MDKRSMLATGLILWAGALQVHMYYLTSSDEYKKSPIAKAGDSVSIGLGGISAGPLPPAPRDSGGGSGEV